MPELPEVETTRRGIAPAVSGHRIIRVHIRDTRLRWPVPVSLKHKLKNQVITSVRRRAKYLLMDTEAGSLIMHLGMSGSLRIVPLATPFETHDHFALDLDNGKSLRLRDPRRFGAVLWGNRNPEQHKLLRDLGPEPLDPDLPADYLVAITRKRSRAIRDTLLDSHLLAGVGNIYANEALFQAGIRPTKAAGRLTRNQCIHLLSAIQAVLRAAIRAGGTTLRDFRNSADRPGYFRQRLQVYGRKGEACLVCGAAVRSKNLHGRSIFYCTHCQM